MDKKEGKNKEVSNKNIVYVFVDASNLWEAQKAKGRFFDYEKLRNFIKNKFDASSIDLYPIKWTRKCPLFCI